MEERRKRVVGVVEDKAAGMTNTAIAEKRGVSEMQIRRDIKEAVSTSVETELPSTVKGRDGKTYPARKPRGPRKPKEPPPPPPEEPEPEDAQQEQAQEEPATVREQRPALSGQNGAAQADLFFTAAAVSTPALPAEVAHLVRANDDLSSADRALFRRAIEGR